MKLVFDENFSSSEATRRVIFSRSFRKKIVLRFHLGGQNEGNFIKNGSPYTTLRVAKRIEKFCSASLRVF
ncbi:hypothetical protein [Flavobacterium sp.]|uniref:hypothetical protein n=1 Tax=Flavobacterium sp. TaxID=239 RepID=UPI00286C4458|nr:hypothetical protein [Flavobacterium sp.]